MSKFYGSLYKAEREAVDTGFQPIEITHKNSFRTAQSTRPADWLLLFREIIVILENHTKHISVYTKWENEGFLNNEVNGAYNFHWDLDS